MQRTLGFAPDRRDDFRDLAVVMFGKRVKNFGYAYDPAGNLALRTNNTLIQSFATDNANELVNITRNNQLTVAGVLTTSNQFTVNGAGAAIYHDLTFATTNGVALVNGPNTFTFVATSNSVAMTNRFYQVLPVAVSLRSDANGNLVWDGQHAYEYDAANELTRVTVTNSFKTEYAYDGFGRRRVTREYRWDAGTAGWAQTNEVHYVYDGMNVLQERDSNNVPKVSYTRGMDLSGSMQGAGGIGGLLARTDGSGSAFYHADGNGNITAMIDSSGNPVARYLYDGYGNLLGMWGTLAQANTYRFSSKELDARSGLYYYGYRYYAPNFQRWLNQDPIQERGGINLYSFVRKNPINLIDTDGRLVTGVEGTGIATTLGTGTTGGAGSTMTVVATEVAAGGGPEDPFTDVLALATLASAGLSAINSPSGDSLPAGNFMPGGGIGGGGGAGGSWDDLQTAVANSPATAASVSPPRKPPCNGKATTGFPGEENNDHHRLPRQFKPWFEAPPRNLNIEDYKTPMPFQWHLGADIGLHPNGYNDAWANFISANPNASAEQTLQFMSQLENSMGFGILPP